MYRCTHCSSLRQPGLPAEDSDGLFWTRAMHIPSSPSCHWFIWAQPMYSVTPKMCMLQVCDPVLHALLHKKKKKSLPLFQEFTTHTHASLILRPPCERLTRTETVPWSGPLACTVYTVVYSHLYGCWLWARTNRRRGHCGKHVDGRFIVA